MSSLFKSLEEDAPRPLADRLRPKNLDEIVGQQHLLSAQAPLTQILQSKTLPSLIFWGPAGCGKTTLSRLLADHTNLYFESVSAIFSGVADLRKIFESAKARRETGQGTLLFVDEIHRFNRAQQDAFLPYVEDGTITLIGATTENPSFELNNALLSRCQVMILERLEETDLEQLICRAEQLEHPLNLTKEAREYLKKIADGDGRFLLNLVEQLIHLEINTPLNCEELKTTLQSKLPVYDKGQENHFNLISALHKSVRGSDVDAALYWFCRMLKGGEDPRYIARRLMRIAVEDIGLADPQALSQTLHASEIYERLGSPEGELALAQALIYLATAPKSIAVYDAYKMAMHMAEETGSLPPPKHIMNAPTKMMKEMGYGANYVYDPDTKDGFSGQNYFPDDIPRPSLYQPIERGFERDLKKRLDYWEKLRSKK